MILVVTPGRTSRRPTATLMATPVHRCARLSLATGHGSFWSCSRMPVKPYSHCEMGRRKRAAPKDAGGGPWGAAGPAPGRAVEVSPSISWIALGAYSLVPRNTNDLGHSA